MTIPAPTVDILHGELQSRRRRLQQAIPRAADAAPLEALLHEVDSALDRMVRGTYGLCETCHDPIEPDRLMADPLLRFCLDHLTAEQQHALEDDLRLAARLQTGLLPPPDFAHDGWQSAYVYRPHGVVSGDYCDLVPAGDRGIYFMLGDVSGKGVAASMLMAQLHATFRTLIDVGLPLAQMMARASRLFCESALPTQYATLVCGRASPDGGIEIANAGHPSPALLGARSTGRVEATGLPVGMFCSQQFEAASLRAAHGDTLLLCTDGATDSENPSGEPFGLDRLIEVAAAYRDRPLAELVGACHEEIARFRGRAPLGDDLTLLAIRRTRD
jgi:sigma-B regulation protein RsbU (phosphoserine phosphatase)